LEGGVSVPVNQIICGDNVETLRTLPDACVDSCVTDPPYGLEFMGKAWDKGVPGVELWREVLRVLKPGGHLLAFAGTRTQHRMATAIEDAGFEIRDMIAWVYGSGFPKSLDVGKAIDKRGGNVAGFTEFRDAVRDAMQQNGISRKQLQDALGNHMLSHYLTAGSQPAVPVLRDYRIIRDTVGLGDEFDELFNDEAEREVVGQRLMNDTTKARAGFTGAAHSPDYDGSKRVVDITAPATEAAKQWAGWGTALKPSLEPITVARKPLCGTVAANVLQHGTGGLNVDGCRVAAEGGSPAAARREASVRTGNVSTRPGTYDRPLQDRTSAERYTEPRPGEQLGRWPANLIHDGSDEVVGLFPEDGEASAARFFYCAKAGPEERRQSKHPTIKPVALMRYLVRLVTPPGGLVLDPFGGSGTTAEAARLEHCRFLLMELSPEYCADAAERLRQGVLF
jgi:DNA modification methylase